jgi:catechol 2,3-dioxygenase-like lactoylglutathione lyase family enzyme
MQHGDIDMPPDPVVTTENPLIAGAATLLPQPCVLVIFGAAGDLSWRKLLPALYNLNVDGVLPANFAVLGFGVGSKGDGDAWIRERARDGIAKFSRRPPEDSHLADFTRALFYLEGSFNDSRAYADLKAKGITFITEPQDRAHWGIRTAHFRDPDGNLLEIYNPLAS